MSPSFLQILILGIIQGAAELLPVSSSAHVIAAEKLMHLNPSNPEMTFLLAMLHTGTMFAVIAYFWSAWKRSFFSSAAAFRDAAVRVVLATVASGGVLLLFKVVIEKGILHGQPGASMEDLFSNLYLIAVSLAAVGVLILVAGLRVRSVETEAPGAGAAALLSLSRAAWIGAAQGLALPFRGFSRSGATISTGLLLGAPRRAVEEFSFALAVVITPPVVAREFLRLLKLHPTDGVHLGSLTLPGVFGMVCSFAAGLGALRWLSGWLEKGRWHYFGIYCLAAAAGIGALAGFGY